MSSHPLPPSITYSIPIIKISVNKWARVRRERGSSISLKNECICSVTAVALGTFNLEFVLRFELAELKPDAIR